MLSVIVSILVMLLMLVPGMLLSRRIVRDDGAARLAIGSLLGFCLIILGGLLIALVGRLDGAHWLFLVALLAAAAWVVSGSTVLELRRNWFELWPPSRKMLVPLSLCVVALGVALSAYRKAVNDEASVIEFPVVQMWMLEARNGQTMKIGLNSRLGEEASLAVEISWNEMVIASWPKITLSPGETLVRETVLPNAKASGRIRARLFRDADRQKAINEVSLSLVR